MTSLEDRCGSVRLDVLIHTYWSRASDDPLLTVGALGASRHLAHAWPALRSDHSLVRSVELVAARRLPGAWTARLSPWVGRIPMLLWSTMVVKIQARNGHWLT